MAKVIDKENLEELNEKLSDSQIAKMLGVSRTYIVHLRKAYGIKANAQAISTGRIGELFAILSLLNQGYSVRDMNSINKTAPYDILVDGKIRIDVKSAVLGTEKCYKYQFGNSKDKQIALTSNVTETKTGRTLKKYSESCDYIVLVTLSENTQVFVIPSNHPDLVGKQTISISNVANNRFNQFRNGWDLLRGDENVPSNKLG